jgi:hypothetical protein
MCFETVWVEIFSETQRAWTCFFEYLELTFASFFYFLFWIFIPNVLVNRNLFERMGVDLKNIRLRKGYQILWMDKKTNKTIKTLFIRPKNLILFLIGFVFWWCQ